MHASAPSSPRAVSLHSLSFFYQPPLPFPPSLLSFLVDDPCIPRASFFSSFSRQSFISFNLEVVSPSLWHLGPPFAIPSNSSLFCVGSPYFCPSRISVPRRRLIERRKKRDSITTVKNENPHLAPLLSGSKRETCHLRVLVLQLLFPRLLPRGLPSSGNIAVSDGIAIP